MRTLNEFKACIWKGQTYLLYYSTVFMHECIRITMQTTSAILCNLLVMEDFDKLLFMIHLTGKNLTIGSMETPF